jgi:hypothetical protein
MADFLKLQGTTLDSFSIGLKTNKSTITVDGTSFILNKQLDMDNANKIVRVTNPEDPQDVATKKYVDDADALKADKVTGGSTNGKVAGLDSTGDLTNTGITATNVVLLDEDQELTNKTIDADNNTVKDLVTGNFASGVIVTSISGSSTDLEIPTAEAVYEYVTAGIAKAIILQGAWNANTNVPNLAGISPEPPIGYAWVVSVGSPTRTLGGITGWDVNDWAVKGDGTGVWLKIANQDAAAIWGNITGNIANQTDLQIEFLTKADKVISATNGDVASLDVNGNLEDSGILATNVVLLDADQILTNKTIDADSNTISNLETDNFASGVIVTTVDGSSTDLEIPTAQAVYEVITTTVGGAVQSVKIPIAKINKSSTYSLPNGSTIKSVTLNVTEAYTAGATIAAAVGAVAILGTDDNDAQTISQYTDPTKRVIATGNVIAVTVAGSPSDGASTLTVNFVISPLV